jgi:hypothetical protein
LAFVPGRMHPDQGALGGPVITLKQLTQSRLIYPAIAFLHGAMLMAMFFLWMMSSYDDGLYDQIVGLTIQGSMNQEQKVLTLMQKTNQLLRPRSEFFASEGYINWRDTLFRSGDIQLMDAKGSCGSHTHVFARLLQRAGIEVRIAQMRCGSVWGAHILLEAKIDGKWVTLDPYYNLSFRKEDGSLASFQDVKERWDDFKSQVPPNYNSLYAYEDVRYTNWTKIPLVMPAVRSVLGWFMGSEVENLSIRSFVLNLYKAYLVILVGCYLLLVSFTAFLLSARSPHPRMAVNRQRSVSEVSRSQEVPPQLTR